MTESKVLQLKFKTSSGKSATVTIANPRENLTLADARGVAKTIVDKGVFEGSDKMVLATFEEAEVVTTQKATLA